MRLEPKRSPKPLSREFIKSIQNEERRINGRQWERSRLGTKKDGTVREREGGGKWKEGREEGWGSLYVLVLVVSEKAEGGMRF